MGAYYIDVKLGGGLFPERPYTLEVLNVETPEEAIEMALSKGLKREQLSDPVDISPSEEKRGENEGTV